MYISSIFTHTGSILGVVGVLLAKVIVHNKSEV